MSGMGSGADGGVGRMGEWGGWGCLSAGGQLVGAKAMTKVVFLPMVKEHYYAAYIPFHWNGKC